MDSYNNIRSNMESINFKSTSFKQPFYPSYAPYSTKLSRNNMYNKTITSSRIIYINNKQYIQKFSVYQGPYMLPI